MKKLIYILLLSVGIISTSCSDFLETSSPSQFTNDVVFTTVTYSDYAVTGIYDLMLQDHTYSSRLPLTFATNSDIEFAGASASDYNANSNRGVSNYYGKPDNVIFNNTWTYLYRMVERANICIAGIQSSPVMTGGDGEAKTKMKALLGEALTLRSLAYFELVRNWGDVPFKTEPTQYDLSNVYLPSTDRDTIYDHIIGDLQEAQEYVPWIGVGTSTTVERVTKGFVKGLLARVALTRGGYSIRNKAGFPTERGSNWQKYYEIANKACAEVIESGKHKLNPSYVNIFKNQCALTQDGTYREDMFEVAFGLAQNGEIGYSIGIRFYANKKYGYGNNANVVNTSAYYLYSFDKSDLRKDVSVAYYVYSNSTGETKEVLQSNPMTYNIGKWDQRWMGSAWLALNQAAANKFGYGVNWCLMRYSDILLMYAETENALHNGPTTEAKNALKAVRARAFDATQQQEKVINYVDNLNDESSFFNAIVNERAWEFGGEAIRKYDLIRWNMLTSKIQEQRDALKNMLNGQPAQIMDKSYSALPKYLFYKYKSDNEILDKENMNFYNDWGTDEIAGYTKIGWLSGVSDATKTDLLNRIDLFSSGLNQSGVTNRHLYPISSTVINESQNKLSNSYNF